MKIESKGEKERGREKESEKKMKNHCSLRNSEQEQRIKDKS